MLTVTAREPQQHGESTLTVTYNLQPGAATLLATGTRRHDAAFS